MATLRQKGPPTCFTTLSSAEFDWDELAQQIYQTNNKKEVTIEFIKYQSQAWRNKLISNNVVQTVVHFAKRTDKIMSLLRKQTIFTHENVEYSVIEFFYRVEFQARGAPHLHCMFWLEGGNGEIPPSLHKADEEGKINFEENAKLIANFGSSVICGSSNDVNCKDHKQFDSSCDGCKRLKEIVEHYQTHSHKATCLKKKKLIKIMEYEGHGRLDNNKEDFSLIVQTCRFNFPKNPSDETVFLPVFPESYDKKDLKKAKEDYNKIRKYLLRLTDGDKFREQEQWKNFTNYSFKEFLYEVGMFQKDKDITDEAALATARERYFTALRCEVKSSGMLFYNYFEF